MKKIFTSFFLCFFLLAGCSNEPLLDRSMAVKQSTVDLKENITSDFIPSTYTIVSIGDSLTQGVGDSTKRGGYLPYLEERLEEEKSVEDAVFYNFGVSGNRTSQVLNRVKTQEVKAALKKADIVMITTGGNDVMKVVRENFTGLQLEDFDKALIGYEKTLSSLIQSIQKEKPDATIVLIGLYNPFYAYFNEMKELDMVMKKWNQVSQSVLQKYENTIFVDIADEFRENEENLLYTDYFHPNDQGYQLIAEKAFTTLQDEALHDLADKKFLAMKKGNEEDE
ncbi:SGNH/GDSL hydrolase family protein [Robertmurraya andreesenii]|uniref:Lysophospholipase L1-like esterase n=1 Tax=Anoxybacillus andreesenii TaxID=1325932 RepID=A0ABT9V2E3_9BACL|nr:SGNH/GDSL hydrolase family protein [Robertmurraya andreesenii]MDQ0155104.1 lysophospholipase L1-like esterase [Robertmurraya andreesenii]